YMDASAVLTWFYIRAPLFPYTTLFRSSLLHSAFDLFLRLPFEAQRERDVFEQCQVWVQCIRLEDHATVPTPDTVRKLRVPAAPQDRKSRRLNSSHVAISYAVVCLNKKM